MPAGRPPIYTSEDFDRFLDRMQEGEFAKEIAQTPGMPGALRVRRLAEQDPEFGIRYARAREMQAHAHAELAVMAARSATPETAQVARIQFDAERWIAGKLAPRHYGDKIQQEVTGKDGAPLIPTLSVTISRE